MIEDGRRGVQVGEIEERDHLVAAEEHPIPGRRPAEKGEAVHDGRGRIAARPQLSDRGRSVPLRQGSAVGAQDEGQVREPRRGQAHLFVEPELQGRVGQVILTSHDVRDLHGGVVHDSREVVGRPAVLAADHGIERLPRAKIDVPAEPIGHDAVMADPEPQGVRIARGGARERGRGIEPRAPSHVARRPSRGDGHEPVLLQKRLRAEAGVDRSAHPELLEGSLVESAAARLPVRAVGSPVASSWLRPLVPVEPEPGQILVDRGLRAGVLAVHVRVLQTENECPPLVARQEPVEQGGADVPAHARAHLLLSFCRSSVLRHAASLPGASRPRRDRRRYRPRAAMLGATFAMARGGIALTPLSPSEEAQSPGTRHRSRSPRTRVPPRASP